MVVSSGIPPSQSIVQRLTAGDQTNVVSISPCSRSRLNTSSTVQLVGTGGAMTTGGYAWEPKAVGAHRGNQANAPDRVEIFALEKENDHGPDNWHRSIHSPTRRRL